MKQIHLKRGPSVSKTVMTLRELEWLHFFWVILLVQQHITSHISLCLLLYLSISLVNLAYIQHPPSKSFTSSNDFNMYHPEVLLAAMIFKLFSTLTIPTSIKELFCWEIVPSAKEKKTSALSIVRTLQACQTLLSGVIATWIIKPLSPG